MTVFRLPIALLDLVARELGVDPVGTSFKPLPTGSREAALERGEVNLVAGGVRRSPTSGGRGRLRRATAAGARRRMVGVSRATMAVGMKSAQSPRTWEGT